MKGREKSDDCIVPEGRRKAVPTSGGDQRGGKAVTASEEARQLELFVEPVDSPRGDVVRVGEGQPDPAPVAALMSANIGRSALPAMEMEGLWTRHNIARAQLRLQFG